MKLFLATFACALLASLSLPALAQPMRIEEFGNPVKTVSHTEHGITEYDWSAKKLTEKTVAKTSECNDSATAGEHATVATIGKAYVQTFSEQPPVEASALFTDIRFHKTGVLIYPTQ